MHPGAISLHLDAIGAVLMPGDSLATAQPVLLKFLPIKQPVIQPVRRGLVLGIRTSGAVKTHRVAPAMLKQILEAQQLELLRPNPIGVWPWGIHRIRCNALHHHAAMMQFRSDAKGGRTAPDHQHIRAISQGQPSADGSDDSSALASLSSSVSASGGTSTTSAKRSPLSRRCKRTPVAARDC